MHRMFMVHVSHLMNLFFVDNAGVIVNVKGEMKGKRNSGVIITGKAAMS